MNKIIRWYDFRNHSTDMILDRLLNRCIDSGIVDYHIDKSEVYEGYCKFFNGVEYRFWNRSIPYAWLARGMFEKDLSRSMFEKDSTTIYLYDGAMPKKWTMNKFYNAICEYMEKEITR
jgi:hypothetical protein